LADSSYSQCATHISPTCSHVAKQRVHFSKVKMNVTISAVCSY